MINSSTEERDSETNEREGARWMDVAIQNLVALLLVTVVLAAYHHFIVSPMKQHIGVVDISEILSLKELELTIKATQAGSTDVNAGNAYDEISGFAKEIEVALAEIKRECNCNLMVKAAVVNPDEAQNYTPKLKDLLGMDKGLSQDKLIEKLRNLGDKSKSQNGLLRR